MPGNEPGDRVHNFFGQDLLFQGQQLSLSAEVSGEYGYPSQFKHGPNFIQSNLRPNFVRGPNEMQQPNMNSFGYGIPFHQSGQNEESLLAMGISSRGLRFHGLQQSVPNNHFTNSLVPSDAPLSASGFDRFSGQQQTIHQQPSMPQFLQPQMSGNNDTRTLHQQLMIRRMQECQRQQQLNSRQHQYVNGSTLVDGGTNFDVFQHPSSAEDGANWIFNAYPNLNGSPNGLGYQPHFDQSLHGVPIANDSYAMRNRSSSPQSQKPASDSYRSDNQHNLMTGQATIAPSKNEAALDPEEEMFLFGSDENLRNAFEAVPLIGEEVNIFSNGGLSNDSDGSWGSLVQSATEQTSGHTPKEFGLVFEGGPLGKEQHINNNLLQASAASLYPNQAGMYNDALSPSILPGSDRLNSPDNEQLKHSLQYRQDTMMQGSMNALWKQDPGLSYDIELGHMKTGHGRGTNDPLAQSHNLANAYVQNNSLFNQWRSAQSRASSQEGKTSEELQSQANVPNMVFGSLSSHDGDKTNKFEKYGGKENPSERHHSSLNQHSSHGYKEGGLPTKVSEPRKFRYHPMGNVEEDMIAEHNLQQATQARATSQQNSLFGLSNLYNQAAANSTVPRMGHSRELQGHANDAENKSSDFKNPLHQGLTVPTSISQNMLELLHKADKEKDRRGFELHLGPPSQRLQVSQLSQGGKTTNSPHQMPENMSSAFISGIPSSKNHLQSQQSTMPRLQTVINSGEPSPYQNILESSSALSMGGVTEHKSKESTNLQSEYASTERVEEVKGSVVKEVAMKNHFENSPSDSTSMLGEVKDLGHPNFLPDETQSLTNADFDVINEGSKIKEGPRSLADAHVTSVKASIVDIIPGNVSQYESLKEGQMLEIHDDSHQDNLTTKAGEEHMFALRKPTSGLNALNSDKKGSSASLAASEIERFSHTSAVDGHLGHKKRKNDTFGLQPWHKEISDDSRSLMTQRAEAVSIKRVSEKVDDIAEPIENASLLLRAKRRLMTSSLLTQQLIGHLPENILSVDAISSYDVAPYYASRIALGDACQAVSNLPPKKHKSMARNAARCHEMASKELNHRLTAIIGKLQSTSSLAELRTKSQEVEALAILRRLSRFHVSSTTTVAGDRKPSPHRFVKAAPLTESIPDGVNCLSL